MKKYLFLFSITTLLIIGMLNIPRMVMGETISVNITKIAPSKAESTVICSGKIEYSEINDIIIENPSIIEKINIHMNDLVKKDDILFILSGAVETYQSNDNNNRKREDSSSQFSNLDINNFSSVYEAYNNILEENKKNKLTNKNYTSDGKLKEIKSNYSGIISSVSVSEKEMVEEGKCICSISNKEKLQVRACVSEAQISDVKINQSAIISGLGFKDSEYQGHVCSISNEAKQIASPMGQETVVEIIIKIDSPAENIKPGFTAKCKIITEEKHGVIIVPYESIKTDKRGGNYVYVLSGNSAEKTYVILGRDFETGVEIVSGLTFDDQIVTDSDKIFNKKNSVPIINEESEESD